MLGFGDFYFYIENPINSLPALAHIIQYTNNNINPSIYNPTLPIMSQVLNGSTIRTITLQATSGMGFIEENDNTKAIGTRTSRF